ncbi:MAG: hypothetical protein ACE5Q3_17270, partial [Alphaproteobacteria bacterium]
MKAGIFVQLGFSVGAFLTAHAGELLASDLNQSELAPEVQSIFEQNCARCHGPPGVRKYDRPKGGFDFVLDLGKLAKTRKLIEPGHPDRSKLFRLVASDEMPDGAQFLAEEPVPEADKEVIRQWIASLGDGAASPGAERSFIGRAEIERFIKDDLATMDPRHRPLARYFTLAHLYNAGESDERMEIYRQGLAKALNSLSWQRRVVRPHVVDPAGTILRVLLHDLGWDEDDWQNLADAYAYYDDAASYAATPSRNDGRALYGFSNDVVRPVADREDSPAYVVTAKRLAYLRADWFVAKATLPPLYYDLLDIPGDVRKLEARLGVNARRNIYLHRVARAGIQESGVSQYNRLLERHDALFGAYWKSYDFADDDPGADYENRKDLLHRPLGPDGRSYGETEAPESLFFSFVPFKHNGGEVIFNLPNGFQGYMLIDAVGERIDEAPTVIVQDRNHPRDSTIYAGISCMSCHADGMRDARDEVRAFANNSGTFYPQQLAEINALYPPDEVFQELLKEDRERFRSALVRAGIDPELRDASGYEPIFALAERFERPLSLAQAAAELGLRSEPFLASINDVGKLNDVRARLVATELPRQQFGEYFDDMLAAVERTGDKSGQAAAAPHDSAGSDARFGFILAENIAGRLAAIVGSPIPTASAKETEAVPAAGETGDVPRAAPVPNVVTSTPRIARAKFSAPAKVRANDRVWRIHIASVRNREDVDDEWLRLKGLYPEQLTALEVAVERVVLDRGIFYRL